MFKKGAAPPLNNVELGRFGRWRSNVWCYPGASSVGSDAREGLASIRPSNRGRCWKTPCSMSAPATRSFSSPSPARDRRSSPQRRHAGQLHSPSPLPPGRSCASRCPRDPKDRAQAHLLARRRAMARDLRGRSREFPDVQMLRPGRFHGAVPLSARPSHPLDDRPVGGARAPGAAVLIASLLRAPDRGGAALLTANRKWPPSGGNCGHATRPPDQAHTARYRPPPIASAATVAPI